MSKYVIRKQKIKSTKSRDEKVNLALAFETVYRWSSSYTFYLCDGDSDRREILHDGTYRSRHFLLPFGGGTPRDPQNPKLWA